MPMFGMGASMSDEERRRLSAMQQSGGMPDQPITYTPGAQRAMNNAPRLEDAPKRQSYWQGGDKFTARDGIAGALAAIGDGFSTWANGPSAGGATNMLIGGRGRAIEQAKAAQAQAQAAQQREADLRAVGIDPARGRLLGDSVGGVVAGQMKPPEAPKAGSFEWYQTADPQQRALYDQYNPFVVSTGQGPVAVPRRPAVGTKISMADLGGGEAPTMQNTPAPQLNAQGNPVSLSRAQYQAIVAEMGQSATDDYLRRNNIRVTN